MKVRVITTGVHGALDYLASGANLAFPRMLGLREAPWAVLVPRIDGVAGASYSLLTDYELGALKVLPMPAHLAFDAAKGARYWLPHVLMGVADVLAAATSKTE